MHVNMLPLPVVEARADGELTRLSERDLYVTLAAGELRYEELGTLQEFWKPADMRKVTKTLSFR